MKKTVLWMLTAWLLTACGSKSSQMPEANNDFAVVTLNATEAQLETSYPATIKGMQDVEIRPKVSGFITKLCVKEGQAVKKIYPDALACDMESAAVAQVCLHYGVPFLTFRLISDVLSSEAEHQQAYEGFWKDLKANSFSFLQQLLEKL